tara:strand:- start:14815 stop:14982 length:168 start_codon:yes stop_codon:yes gene_type:complete
MSFKEEMYRLPELIEGVNKNDPFYDENSTKEDVMLKWDKIYNIMSRIVKERINAK